MEHEARNRSDRERIILLFEIWRPEISEADREALTLLLEAAKSALRIDFAAFRT